MTMKVFLTGVSGILGTDICHQLMLANHDVLGFNSQNIALADYHDVEAKVNAFQPHVVIHCAAMTNVDLCEDDKETAYTINVTGTQNLAVATQHINAKLVYISSCGVYGNGKTTPYTEQDATNPQTYHHITKLEGEKMVQKHNPNYIIIRPGWLFGGTITHKKNFVEARRKEALNTPLLRSAADKVGSPTYTADLARQIIHLLNQDVTGVYNAVNEGCASRFDYVSEIIKQLNLSTKVEPVNSNEFPRKANMPDNECLQNYNLSQKQYNQMRNWKEALHDYINTTYKS